MICEGYVLSVAVELMNMEHWLKDADRKTGALRKACSSVTLTTRNAM
jgi:hypothetical protein